jgi:hypothetical protein
MDCGSLESSRYSSYKVISCFLGGLSGFSDFSIGQQTPGPAVCRGDESSFAGASEAARLTCRAQRQLAVDVEGSSDSTHGKEKLY